MNKKISLGIALSWIFLAIALSVTITMLVSMDIYNDIIKDFNHRSDIYSDISDIDEIIRDNYYGDINEDILKKQLAEGYIDGIEDKYSYYMTKDDYKEYKEEQIGNKQGIGVIAVFDSKSNGLYVSEVSEGSPAQLQGIQKGDIITAVDSVNVTSSNYKELLNNLEGEKYTKAQVTFTHEGESKTVSVGRGYSAQTVYYNIINDVGYIKITDFYSTTADQLRTAVEYMNQNRVTSVVFDVRNNETGSISDVAKCIDILVPVATEGNNAIAVAVDKDEKVIETFASDSNSVNLSMVVLVNSKTSGAAELFACDLRDFGLAQLVGEKTAGNGTMQKVFELDDGCAIALTVAHILPYKSESFNDVGLEPDHKVELTKEQAARFEMLTPQEDAQLQKALSLLNN